MKIFETPSTLPLSFVAAPKTNPGTGGHAGLIKYRATLKLDCLVQCQTYLRASLQAVPQLPMTTGPRGQYYDNKWPSFTYFTRTQTILPSFKPQQENQWLAKSPPTIKLSDCVQLRIPYSQFFSLSFQWVTHICT